MRLAIKGGPANRSGGRFLACSCKKGKCSICDNCANKTCPRQRCTCVGGAVRKRKRKGGFSAPVASPELQEKIRANTRMANAKGGTYQEKKVRKAKSGTYQHYPSNVAGSTPGHREGRIQCRGTTVNGKWKATRCEDPLCKHKLNNGRGLLLRNKAMRCEIAGRYYCHFCSMRLGEAGRAALVAEREVALQNYPFPVAEPSLHHDPRPAAVIAEYAVLLKAYNAVRKGGCKHAPLIGNNPRRCLCLQLYRWMGVAIVDQNWTRRTQKMREGASEVPPPSEEFKWKPASFLDNVEAQPDCLRHVMVALHSHWGGTKKVGWFSRMGHICTLETAMKIQSDGHIKAQTHLFLFLS